MIHKTIQAFSLLAIGLLSFNASASYIDSDGHLILDFAEYSSGETVNSYGGINWSNTSSLSATDFGVGDDNAAFNTAGFIGGLSLSSASSNGFDLYDAYFKAFNDTTFTIDGTFVGGEDITAQSFNLTAADDWSQVDINLFNINTLNISAANDYGIPQQFLIDNVDVPEPSSLALFGLGLLGLSLARIKQRK